MSASTTLSLESLQSSNSGGSPELAGSPKSAALADSEAGAAGRLWCVYLLRCADGTLYAGCTNDLARRLLAHGRGRVKYTRSRRPVALAYREPVSSHSAALRREAEVKRLSRARKLALCAHANL